MRLCELFALDEARLRLRPGTIDNSRGSYGSLVAVMRPEDFIRLTTTNPAEYDKIFSDDFAGDLSAYNRGKGQYNKNDYYMPFLWVSYPDGRVTGHEGRHRAAMVARAGGDKFPAVIHFREPRSCVVRWQQQNLTTEETTREEEPFATHEEAYAFADTLETRNRDYDHDFYYSRIGVDGVGGNALRGHPGRSDRARWLHAAWTRDDMPEFLIGQFDPAIRVPTSTMRVGPVKGYNHYRS